MTNQVLQNDVCQYLSSYFNLKVASSLDDSVDIVISESPISVDTISALRLQQQIVYCHQKLVQPDYEKITEALEQRLPRKNLNHQTSDHL